jgi:hypothetical protein
MAKSFAGMNRMNTDDEACTLEDGNSGFDAQSSFDHAIFLDSWLQGLLLHFLSYLVHPVHPC